MPTAAEQLNHTDDGLDDLMNLIDPQEPAAAAPGTETPGQTLDDILGEDPAAAPAATQPTAPAAPAPAAPAATPATGNVSDLVERLAQAQLAREERERQEREAAATRERETAASKRAQLFAADELELTDEEKQVYGQSQGVISKLVRRELQRYHAERVVPELAHVEQMRAQIGASEQTSRAAADRAMNATIRAAVPEIDTYAQSPEWNAFLTTPVPEFGPGVTRANLLQAHLQNLNPEAAIALIRAFRPGAGQPAAPAVTPGRAGGGAPASVAAVERGRTNERFPYSRYVELSEKAQRGEISMDKFDKITDFYFDKMEQGLVDMNA